MPKSVNQYSAKLMGQNIPSDLSNFFVAGISYKKTNAETRGLFAINDDQYHAILDIAPATGFESLFILSTCNRTEIYGFAENAVSLVRLLCTQTSGCEAFFMKEAYIKKGTEAVEHLFNVGSGLDSQILGDYEIVGQLKRSVKYAKDRNFINCFMERLVNCVLQASKAIKNNTGLSGGTVSVSFAAVQFIKDTVPNCEFKSVLLMGTGKIGKNTCKNLISYLGCNDITLINRSEEKAAQLAKELNLRYAPITQLTEKIGNADIILVATNAPEPVILSSQLENKGKKLVIDLSIPYNVQPSAKDLPDIRMVNIDELSKMRDRTLNKRKSERHKAETIIEKQLAEFLDWYRMRKHAPMLNAIKSSLNQLALLHQNGLNNHQTRCPFIATEQKIQQVVRDIAGKIRTNNLLDCPHMDAINQFIMLVDQ